MDISKPGGYTLVWHDEFDGSVLDPARWQLLESMRGSEDTGLADESNPAVMRVEDSQLKLSAIRDKNVDDGGRIIRLVIRSPRSIGCIFDMVFSKCGQRCPSRKVPGRRSG